MVIRNAEILKAILDGARVCRRGSWPTYEGQAALDEVLNGASYDSWEVLPPLQEKYIVLTQHREGGDVTLYDTCNFETARNLVDRNPLSTVYLLRIDPRNRSIYSKDEVSLTALAQAGEEETK